MKETAGDSLWDLLRIWYKATDCRGQHTNIRFIKGRLFTAICWCSALCFETQVARI